jgi:hypothetical protein
LPDARLRRRAMSRTNNASTSPDRAIGLFVERPSPMRERGETLDFTLEAVRRGTVATRERRIPFFSLASSSTHPFRSRVQSSKPYTQTTSVRFQVTPLRSSRRSKRCATTTGSCPWRAVLLTREILRFSHSDVRAKQFDGPAALDRYFFSRPADEALHATACRFDSC